VRRNVGTLAQTGKPSSMFPLVETNAAQSEHEPDKRTVPLDAQRERQALRIFLKSVQDQVGSAAEAMAATEYEFIPSEGEFKGARTFARKVRHLPATNHILGLPLWERNPRLTRETRTVLKQYGLKPRFSII
jgi:hypothetical protein